MGELKAAVKSIAFMFTSNLNKAEKWMAAHPALTVEEKVRREYVIKSMNGKLNETIARRVTATNHFISSCKLLNERYSGSSEDVLKQHKIDLYMNTRSFDELSDYAMISDNDVIKIIDDTRPSRMKAEAKEREENYYTREKSWQYYKTYFEEEEKKEKDKKKKKK